MAFTDTHGETPTCAPGRAGLLTGLHTHNHGVYQTDDGTLFQPDETIATELQGVGYHTIEVGKYLNLFERIDPKWPPGWDEFHGYGGDYYDYTLWNNGLPRRYGHRPSDYSTDVIADLAVGALRRAPKDQPLFAWITPYAMHKPWNVAPRHQQAKGCTLPRWKPASYMEKDVRDKPAFVQTRKLKEPGGYELKRICRGLRSVDQLVGRVVRKLKDLDRLDNTLLVLTSDNGMTFGSQRILHDKKSPYASQVPFHVRWPRVLGRDPTDVDERIQNIDLAPTLCDIAGCRLGPYPTGQAKPDGRSFLRLLTGERTTLEREAVLTSYQDSERQMPSYWSVTTTGSLTTGEGGLRAASQRRLPLDVHGVRDRRGGALRPQQRPLPRLEATHEGRPVHAREPRRWAPLRGPGGLRCAASWRDSGRADRPSARGMAAGSVASAAAGRHSLLRLLVAAEPAVAGVQLRPRVPGSRGRLDALGPARPVQDPESPGHPGCRLDDRPCAVLER